MRGVVPIGVTAPSGATSVILSPGRRPRFSARREPIATPSALVETVRGALLDVVGDQRELVRDRRRGCRARARRCPRLPLPEASAWPSTSGMAQP
jgi:hypothetical protein